MSAHARLSPSKRHRWKRCPASVNEETKYPQVAGPAAIDGTHSHRLLEECIKRELIDPHTLVGQELIDHEGEFIVTADRAERVKVAVDYIAQRVADGAIGLLSEVKVSPVTWVKRDDMSGTVDCIIMHFGMWEIIDYKDGMGAVDVVENDQLEQYALGTLSPIVDSSVTIRYTIIQPKLRTKGLPPINSYDTTAGQLLAKVPSIIEEASRTDDPNASFVPGDIQCKFCSAKGGCKALAETAMEKVGVMFNLIDVSQQSADKDPTVMSDDQIREIMEAAPLLRQLLDGVEAEAKRRLEAGHAVPGLKLVAGRGSRDWTLSDDEMVAVLVKMGVPKSSCTVSKLVSPAQAEKLTWTKKDGAVEKLSDRQLKRLQSDYISKKEGKPTVALDSDNRPAITTTAESLFSAVNNDVPEWLK